jgi:peptide/nickel transport system permease protein
MRERSFFGKSGAAGAGRRWPLRVVYGLLLIALLADLLANDKPLACRLEGQWHFPVFRQLLVDAGLGQWPAAQLNADWHSYTYEFSLWPLIRYTANRLDLKNSNYKSPFDLQQLRSPAFRHWLGTDRLGRDTAAGLVAGTRTAVLVGGLAMGLAGLLGLLLGGLAGFFGDHGWQLSRARLGGGLLGLLAGVFYGFLSPYFTGGGGFLGKIALGFGLLLTGVCLLAALAQRLLRRRSWWQQPVALPLDLLVMRLVEIIDAIPGLMLLLSILAIVARPSIWTVVVVIALIGWIGVARFVRAELLRIRELDYITAARSIGLSEMRILWRHALPNALRPVIITLAFGAAAAILLEAYLSFLGIGLPPDLVTWGGQIQGVRSNIGAWWLAVFPGLAIFVTVASLNVLGESYLERK